MSTAESRVRRSRRLAALAPASNPPFELRDSPDAFFTATRPHGRGVAVRDFSRACLLRLIDYPEMPLRTGARDVVKAGRTALIVRTEFSVGHRLVPAAYKRVTRKTWWKRLTSLFRPNQGLRTFHLGHALLERGIPTARPLAVILPRRFPLHRPTYIATEWVEAASDLHAHFRELEGLPAAVRHRRATAAVLAIGRLVGRLHAERVSHRDLKAGNILIRESLGTAQAFVIDLDGAAIRRTLPWRTRVRNLARLARCIATYPAISRAHVLRGLLAYTVAQNEPIDWKAVWRATAHQM